MNTNGKMVSCEDCIYDKKWVDKYLEKEDK